MTENGPPLVVLIGDSIRMGYQQGVVEALGHEAEVWCPEPNGGDSRNVLAHLDEWVLQRAPDVVHVNCGLHDIKKDFATGTPQVPLEEYAGNVEQILSRLSECKGMRVVWALTTPVNEKWHRANKEFDRFEVDVQAYNERARTACRNRSIEVNDLYALVESIGRDDILREDGVHFSDGGSRLLAGAVASCIRRHLTL